MTFFKCVIHFYYNTKKELLNTRKSTVYKHFASPSNSQKGIKKRIILQQIHLNLFCFVITITI